MELKYGDITIDAGKLPETSVAALMRRGLAHFLGNEQASKVASKFSDEPDATPETKAKYKAECVEAAIAALHAGTIGANLRGPKATPVETMVRQLALREVSDILRQNKLAVPTGDKTIEFPDGAGGKVQLSRSDLIDRRVAKHGERLTKEAEAELRKRDREAQKAGGLEALV